MAVSSKYFAAELLEFNAGLWIIRLKQILPVKYCRFQRKSIHSLHATEIHNIFPRPSGRLAERVDAAGAAEIVLCFLLAPLVQAKRAFLRLNMELRSRHDVQHGSPSGTERAIAAHPFGESLGLKREVDCAAMATAFVLLHYHVSYLSKSTPP
jgi:hypothetical protein